MGMTEFTQAVAVIILVLVVLFIVQRLIARRAGFDSDNIASSDWIGASKKPGKSTIIDRDSYREMPSPPPHIIDWNAMMDERVQSHLPNRKIEAIKAYRELTNAGLKDAKDAVEYYLEHPKEAKSRETSPPLSDAGIRDLLNEGKFEEAVSAYQVFAGVDTFTARSAVEAIQRSMQQPALAVGGIPEDEVRRLLREGRKIEAVKRVREVTNLGLKEALDIVNEIERKLKLS